MRIEGRQRGGAAHVRDPRAFRHLRRSGGNGRVRDAQDHQVGAIVPRGKAALDKARLDGRTDTPFADNPHAFEQVEPRLICILHYRFGATGT